VEGGDRRFALKLLRPELATRSHVVSRFEREAMAASRVRHENVLEVHRPVTILQETRFFTMELLVGLDLADTLASQPRLPLARAVRIARGVARGLGAAHQAGVVHRDVKPENVFLVHAADGSEVVKVLDFGAAWVMGEEPLKAGRITARSGAVGTPEYMAPEQLAGALGHPSADVYSLGIVLYEMLSGAVPFTGATWVEVAQAHARAPVPLLLGAPEPLVRALSTALEKEPARRFPNMAAFEGALAAISAG
jgi:serine/threonine-protein kinase